MESFLKDLKQSLRMFAQSPAFTLAAVAALTLGIGANTAIFSVVNAVLLKPVAFPGPDRIVMFMNTSPQGAGPAASPAKFQHYREQSAVVQDVAAFSTGVVNFTGGSFPEQLRSAQVSADFFRLFGAPVVRGRTFIAPRRTCPADRKVAVLSQHCGRRASTAIRTSSARRFRSAASPTRSSACSGDFDFPGFGPAPQVWLPFQLDPNTTDQGHYFQVAGRLKPGVTLEQAQARLKLSADEYKREVPERARAEQQLHGPADPRSARRATSGRRSSCSRAPSASCC